MLEGRSFVERIAAELSAVTLSITVVGNNPTADERQVESSDHSGRLSAMGALGGVHAALAACSAVWALIGCVRFSLRTRELFAQLRTLGEDFDAVAPVQVDGIPQPLCALYRVEPCLGRAERLIKSGERKPIALLQSVETRWVSFAELSSLGVRIIFLTTSTPLKTYARVRKERN